ncbi:conserved hypothetical protein [Vibrio owensii]|uniref:Resolvase/invertase-type recombinase catalytic domain-containing protein n=1 Tax=Vibrio owensii TaxID=696485 RepID=A0AAU9Q5R0_9VIBR|nr:conserved hypothetical protein [Vibrio owensii]
MPQAYLYARFSTKRQEDGDSLERQTQLAQEWCSRNDVALSEQTFEDLGVSAFKEGSKPALSEFIQAVQSQKVPTGSYLLIEDDDRLSRRGWKHTQDLMHDLVNLGIKVVLVKNNREYNASNINDIGDNIVLMVNADRAHKESERKSQLIRAQRSRARENRQVTGKLPAWIVRDGDGFEFNGMRECILELVNHRANGLSLQSVAKTLNKDGYTTSTGADWSSSGVRSIIENRALYGAKAYFDTDKATGRINKAPIDIQLDIFPSLISFDKWSSIQQKSKSGAGGRTSRKGAYSQLLRCGKCGGALTQRTTTYKDHRRVYRMCVKATEGSCTQKERIREPEKYLDLVLKNLTYKTIESGYESQTPLIQQQLDTLKKTEDMLLEKGLVDSLANLYQKMHKVQSQLDKAIETDRTNQDPVNTSFGKVIDIDDVSKRNVELRKLLKSVEFHLISKQGTRSQWAVVVRQINGLGRIFKLYQHHGFGNTDIIHKFDRSERELVKQLLGRN